MCVRIRYHENGSLIVQGHYGVNDHEDQKRNRTRNMYKQPSMEPSVKPNLAFPLSKRRTDGGQIVQRYM